MKRRLAFLLTSTAALAFGEAPLKPVGVITVDLTRAGPVEAKPLPEFGGKSPQGLEVAATDRYLTFGGKPWYPIAAEFVGARTPRAEWLAELAKYKAAKVGIVVTPAVWIYHESVEGMFDWSGDRDLATVIRDCASLGLPCIVRLSIGTEPSVRNGGLPDWMTGPDGHVSAERFATAGPIFLQSLAGHLRGLWWKDGGPIVGVEIEAVQGIQVGDIKSAAKAAGLEAPFYFTADSGKPAGFIALGTAEPENGSFSSLTDPDPKGDGAYLFHQGSTIGTLLTTGIIPSYRRRPFLLAEDAAAAAVVAMGSGSNFAIYHPFHGGFNPSDAAGPLNARRSPGSPADLPLLNQDGQMPISAAGALGATYHALRALDLFTADFGAALAPLATWLPEKQPSGPVDATTVRWAVRSNGDQGFLFVSNYRRTLSLPPKKTVQFELHYAGGRTQTVPFLPANLAPQATGIWPLNLWMGGVKLLHAAAQPLCRIGSWYVFTDTAGVPGDFLFDRATLAPDVSSHYGNLTAGLTTSFTVTGSNGVEVHILLLKASQAALAWKFRLAGRDHLVLADNAVLAGDALRTRLLNNAASPVLVLPKLEFDHPGVDQGIYYAMTLPAASGLKVPLAEADTNPLKVSEVAVDAAGYPIPPTDAEYDSGQQVTVDVPARLVRPNGNAIVSLTYSGDAARAYVDGKLVADSYFDGTGWRIPVGPNFPAIGGGGLTLKIVPFRTAAPIYVTPGYAPWFGSEAATFPVRIRAYLEQTQTVDLVPKS